MICKEQAPGRSVKATRKKLHPQSEVANQLLHALQALEHQTDVAFANHEAKLGQQQEALAKQSQKGIATLQVQSSTSLTLHPCCYTLLLLP